MTETVDVAKIPARRVSAPEDDSIIPKSRDHRIVPQRSGDGPRGRRPEAPPVIAGHLVDRLVAKTPALLTPLATRVLDEVAPLYVTALRGYRKVPLACRARMRATGEAWAATGLPLEDLLTYFSELTGGLTDALLTQRPDPTARRPAACVIGLTNQLTREFLVGASHARLSPARQQLEQESQDPVANLLTGRKLPAEAELSLAARYLIMVIRHTPDQPGSLVARALRAVGEPGTFVLSGRSETVGLIPERDRQCDQRLARDLEWRLGGQAWTAVAARERPAVPGGYREATDVLDLVWAADRPPGVYRLDDVLLEYAATRNDTVSTMLAAVLEPLVAHAVLYETLDVLVQSDFNRNTAAKNLLIHRSTVDYRLSRIQELTGLDPMSSRGIQVLGTAVAVHSTVIAPHHQRAVGT